MLLQRAEDLSHTNPLLLSQRHIWQTKHRLAQATHRHGSVHGDWVWLYEQVVGYIVQLLPQLGLRRIAHQRREKARDEVGGYGDNTLTIE